MTHKLEKELSKVTKVAREKDEADQDFFARLYKDGNALFDKDEAAWNKLSEAAQKWMNAAGEAHDAKMPIPNFDGEVPAEKPKGKGEEDGETEEAAKAKAGTSRRSSSKSKDKDSDKDKDAPAKSKSKDKEKDGEAKRGRKGSFGEDWVVTKVVEKNPFREGSKAAACFKSYKVGKSVKWILDQEVPRSKLNRHIKRKILTVAAPK